ncbi:MAG TPA: sigma-70 family RNA polymerase sigma factor [Steroidobacteraceae bacterium]|nr:sigma-70 family RNA polymerase sigma factor [Steroidobacteraceae bacterium]
MGMQDSRADLFEAHRKHLLGIAMRIQGSRAEAEDAVQETWLRWSRTEASGIANPQGWLTTVIARICIDVLRTRKARTEEELTQDTVEKLASPVDAGSDVEIADAVGLALLVVIETLAPAERVAFVLHDMFNLPFEDIAAILKRSVAATRQLASRARRRVQGSPMPDPDYERQREIVSAFMHASREGNFSALIATLDPAAVLRADAVAVQTSRARPGAPELADQTIGAEPVARVFKGRAQAAQLATIDGGPGWIFAPGGHTRAAMEFVIEQGRIVEINVIADPDTLEALQLVLAP